jgi:outer membrane protein OmpA-like peptidoglycan-associated protein
MITAQSIGSWQYDTIGDGSARPKYLGHDDDARAKNRRDDLVVR